MTLAIAIVSAAIAIASFLVNGRVSWRKDLRDQDDHEAAEAARLIDLKDQRIAELERKIEELQEALNAIRRQIARLERTVDVYGCWNGPHCENRKPLGAVNPDTDI